MAPCPLSFDDEDTWPPSIVDLLRSRLPMLSAYESERKRIDRLAERDPSMRCFPPPNPRKHERDSVLSSIGQAIAEGQALGYHCTRLCEDEIEEVLTGGLRPLTPELVADRIRRRKACGDLSPEDAQLLLSNNLADDRQRQEKRTGRLWLVLTWNSLRGESDVWRLFGLWGGEALYSCHEGDPRMRKILQNLGVPCLIEVAVPLKDIDVTPAEALLGCFLHRHKVETENRPGLEGKLLRSIRGDEIRSVIRHGNPNFSGLTSCNSWRNQLP